MTKIVVNGVDGNFGSQVAKHIQNLLPKDDLLFTAPREEALKPYQEQGINLTARNSPTSKVAGCKGFGLVQGLAPCA